MRSSSSLVITRGSLQSNIPMRTGSEPLARMTASPSKTLPSSRVRRPGPASVARPATTSTLRAFMRWATPSRRSSATASLRAMKAGKSSVTSPVRTPKAGASCAARRRAAPATMALVGTQPRLRQVPPSTRTLVMPTSSSRSQPPQPSLEPRQHTVPQRISYQYLPGAGEPLSLPRLAELRLDDPHQLVRRPPLEHGPVHEDATHAPRLGDGDDLFAAREQVVAQGAGKTERRTLVGRLAAAVQRHPQLPQRGEK